MKRFVNCFAFALFIIVSIQSVSAARLLIPGGELIGLVLEDQTVTVAAIDEELGQDAKAAGLQVGDRLVTINGQPIHSAADVKQILAGCDGYLQLEVQRSGQTKRLKLMAQATADGPKLGVQLREGVTGVGTVTYYEPQTSAFGALGHGVNQGNQGLLAMEKGQVFEAAVLSVRKGQVGQPGQLMGSLAGNTTIGSLRKNTAQGIFGKLDQKTSGEKLPVAEKGQIHPGDATIRSTINDQGVQEYSVEILKIYANPKCASRNMLLRVTDPRLLETTGGIVQGMSGSPIIQGGMLVGAVTHVLVNDPTTGYGIFIENMLDAAA